MWGAPLQVPPRRVNLYLTTFLDDYSKLGIVSTAQQKSVVPEVAKEVVSFTKKQYSHDLLVLRSDNGALQTTVYRSLGDFLRARQCSTTQPSATALSSMGLQSV